MNLSSGQDTHLAEARLFERANRAGVLDPGIRDDSICPQGLTEVVPDQPDQLGSRSLSPGAGVTDEEVDTVRSFLRREVKESGLM